MFYLLILLYFIFFAKWKIYWGIIPTKKAKVFVINSIYHLPVKTKVFSEFKKHLFCFIVFKIIIQMKYIKYDPTGK